MKSETTSIDSVNVDGRDIKNLLEIAQATNDYFCSIGKNLRDEIKAQPNPFCLMSIREQRILPVSSSLPLML